MPPERSRLDRLPWPVRSILAGTCGTAVLTAAYALERRLRPAHPSQLDYDDSEVPGEIVVSILHLPHLTGRETNDVGLALRWSYGSAFGLLHGILRRRLREPWASIAFGSTLMTATVTMFPLLGRTPPPWRWPRGYLATSLATHVAYAVTVGKVDDSLRS